MDRPSVRWQGEGKWRPFLATAVVVAPLLGCENQRTLPTASRVSRPQAAVESSRGWRQEEAGFGALSDAVPSSGGYYLNSSGQLVVVVRNPEEDQAARSTASTLISSGAIVGVRSGSHAPIIQRGRFTFRELVRWRDVIFETTLGVTDGVISLDLNEAANRVVIGLSTGTAQTAIHSLSRHLDSLGIDTLGISYRVHNPLRATLGPLKSRAHVRSLLTPPPALWSDADPLVGGVQIIVYRTIPWQGLQQGTCTLGIIADYQGIRGLVTASHCSKDVWSTDGYPVFQPRNNRQVGYEQHDPSGWGCGLWNTCRRSDAGFYAIPSTPSERGLIARPRSSSGPGGVYGDTIVDQQRPYFIVQHVESNGLLQGSVVHKIGRITGWTHGVVTNSCVDHAQGDWFFGGQLVAICTDETNYTDFDGDSGGPVFAFPGGNDPDVVTLVGIHRGHFSAGHAVYSRWGRINEDFGGGLVATRPQNLGQPSLTGTMPFLYPALSWGSVPGASIYYVFNGSNLIATTTSTSAVIPQLNVLEYTGTTPPSFNGVRFVPVQRECDS